MKSHSFAVLLLVLFGLAAAGCTETIVGVWETASPECGNTLQLEIEDDLNGEGELCICWWDTYGNDCEVFELDLDIRVKESDERYDVSFSGTDPDGYLGQLNYEMECKFKDGDEDEMECEFEVFEIRCLDDETWCEVDFYDREMEWERD